MFSYFWSHSISEKIEINGRQFKVEIVSKMDDLARGLSGRKVLAQEEGMLFVFEKPGIHSFWMKDMKFPIDIIWINEDKKIIYIKENVIPESYPASFAPAQAAKYVLEINAGLSDVFNIKIGDMINFK